MQNGKLVAGIAAGTVLALFLIPKTRKMIVDAACHLGDSIKDMAQNTDALVNKARKMGVS